VRKLLQLSIGVGLFIVNVCSAQVTTTPVGDNGVIQDFLVQNPGYEWQHQARLKWGTRDTLELPFFDDFSTSSIYPDSTKWLNNQVYVNNHFPVFPPTYNVATFDVLNEFGLPYNNTINKDRSASGDSLLSQPINLNDSAGVAYTVADSIYLSFFIQANGYGYHLNSEDSIRLYFKAENGLWFNVWSKPGTDLGAFEQVIVKVDQDFYLHKGFQFLFTTFTRQVGNANHWHLDYVLLDKDRRFASAYYNDYAIQTFPTNLIGTYSSMPYRHYEVNPGSFEVDSTYVWVSNLNNADKNIEIQHTITYNNTTLAQTQFFQNANNVLAQNNAERRLPAISFSSLGGSEDKRTINHVVEIRERGVQNDFRENDRLETSLVFDDYYAYDDGTAERGFGFDQNANPSNLEGEIAYGFDLQQADTLYAISTYFNQAVYNVSSRRFKYVIWKELEGVNGATEDVILYRSEDQTPVYNLANDRRTFTAYYLDSTLFLEAGRYYIGWYQSSMFNLNVGWDMNFGNRRNNQSTNPNLYYKIFNAWSNSDLPEGTLMMRPHFGASRPLHAGLEPIYKSQRNGVKVYPNPANNRVFFSEEIELATLINQKGLEIKSVQNGKQMELDDVSSGFYFIRMRTKEGEQVFTKLVVFRP
jgi:hypothetical protein